MIGYGGDDSNDDETLEYLAAWREVHSTLLLAVRKAQDAISIQKAQRRYWLEEIAWNLGEDGSLTAFSSWNRPVSVSTSSLSFPIQRGLRAVGTTRSSRKKREGVAMDTLDNAKPAKKPRTKKSEHNLELGVKKPRKGKAEPSAWAEDETPRASPNESDTLERFSQSNSPTESATRPIYDEWDGPFQGTADGMAHNDSVSPLSLVCDTLSLIRLTFVRRIQTNFENESELGNNDAVASQDFVDTPSHAPSSNPYDRADSALQESTASSMDYGYAEETNVSRRTSSTAPRTYTSLQEIATNQGDDSDEDRF
jgi:hypothetical protein